jgi:hypothetical protein
LAAVGETLRGANVAAIYLVHGTFIGPDAAGLLADLSRVAPGMADVIRRWNKQILDSLAGDIGNFTLRYAQDLERSLTPAGTGPNIPVRLLHWSSENHHLGRADGAVRLIHHLVQQPFAEGSRVLIWAHSHGGNVLALVSNLLGSELAARREFFRRASCYFRRSVFRPGDFPEWTAARQALCECDQPLPGVTLDLVTFGTPVRYGWDTNGFGHLLHFIHHRPVTGAPEYLAPFPPTTNDALYAAHGDVIQQLGIAGTNFAPPFWEWRTWLADLRLGELLQSDCRSADLFVHWRLGVRVHDEGENLLVDYGTELGNVAQHLFGHAIYTRREWLPFHAEEVAQRFYGLSPAASATT